MTFWTLIGPGLVAIAALLVLWAMLRQVARRNRSEPESPALWDGRDYCCPTCGAPMRPGWVLLGRGAIWSPRARGRPGSLATIGAALPNTISLRLRPAANMAWRCERCQLLLMDHSRLIH